MSAPNPVKGEVAFGPYLLVFDFNAQCALEKLLGRSMPEIFTLFQPDADGAPPTVSFSTFRALICAMLQRHQPNTSEQVAGNIIEEHGGPQGAADAVKSAFEAMAAQKEQRGPPPKAAGGTGTPSSPRGAKKG